MENNPYDKLIGSERRSLHEPDRRRVRPGHQLRQPHPPVGARVPRGHLRVPGRCGGLHPAAVPGHAQQHLQRADAERPDVEGLHGVHARHLLRPGDRVDPGLNTVGSYDSLHNPPLYYTDLQTVPSGGTASPCQQFDVPMGSPTQGNFANDLATNLPTFSFVTPNKCHDEHNCSIQAGDAYLKTLLPVIFNSQYYQQGELLVVLDLGRGRGRRLEQLRVQHDRHRLPRPGHRDEPVAPRPAPGRVCCSTTTPC